MVYTNQDQLWAGMDAESSQSKYLTVFVFVLCSHYSSLKHILVYFTLLPNLYKNVLKSIFCYFTLQEVGYKVLTFNLYNQTKYQIHPMANLLVGNSGTPVTKKLCKYLNGFQLI